MTHYDFPRAYQPPLCLSRVRRGKLFLCFDSAEQTREETGRTRIGEANPRRSYNKLLKEHAVLYTILTVKLWPTTVFDSNKSLAILTELTRDTAVSLAYREKII